MLMSAPSSQEFTVPKNSPSPNSPSFGHDRKIVAARLGGGGEGIVPPFAEVIRKTLPVHRRVQRAAPAPLLGLNRRLAP